MNGKKRIIPPAVCMAAATVLLAVLLAGKDTMVINIGIRGYQSRRLACALFLAASSAWTVLSAISAARASRKAAGQAYEIPDPPEKKTLTESDRNALYRELADFGAKKWSGMDGIPRLLKQLDSMDEYQGELGRLLEQTEYLKTKPAEIVQRVEDCMYVNVRKLLNYMRIVQTKSRSVMSEKIQECVQKNADLLKKTDDFVVAVVDYVNGDMVPGEEQKTKDYVDSYMFVVLEAIELPETYLR